MPYLIDELATHPWILDCYAFYAPSLHLACEAYGLLGVKSQDQAFGVVMVGTGEEIDWVNMRYPVLPQHPSKKHA